MDSSSVKVKKEIKEESFDFPIKNETKSYSNFKLKVNKERKDNLGLQIGLDIIDRLDLPVKNEVQEDLNPDIAVKKEAPATKSDSTDDIITEKYYCALCQVSCGYSKPPRMNWEWDTHLNSREHKVKMAKKANKEKEKSKAKAKEKAQTKKNHFPKGATMFMKGFKKDTTKEDIKNALLGTFGVESKALASIENGNNGTDEKAVGCGYVIFCKENAANELLAKIKGRSEMFKIKGADIKCRVVKGQEENAWHQHLARKKFKKKA